MQGAFGCCVGDLTQSNSFIAVKIIWWSEFLQDGRTPLHIAAEKGFQCIVELLLEKGVNAEVRARVWSFLTIVYRLVISIVCNWLLGETVH